MLDQGVAVTVLQKLGLDLAKVRMEVEKQVGTGPDEKLIGNIPYTPRVKKVLALAAKEAKNLNHTYVGTEHILLGLLREGDGLAGRVLKNLNVDIEQTRLEILKELDPETSKAPKNLRETEAAKPQVSSKAVSTPIINAVSLASEGAMYNYNFTPRARRVLRLARNEAERLNHLFLIGEHILLGVIALGDGVAANLLLKHGLDLPKARAEVEKRLGPGTNRRLRVFIVIDFNPA